MNTRATKEVTDYYRKSESRLGYRFVLSGVRHFGWYPSDGSVSRWKFRASQRAMELLLGRRLNLPISARVLDAGCGEGHVATTVSEEFGYSVHGIDVLPESIARASQKARRRGTNQTHFEVGDYHSLQFEDRFFDGVYTMETFVHARDIDGVLSEFYRVLRPGGALVMIEYASANESDVSKEAYAALRDVATLGAMPAWLELQNGVLEDRAVGVGFAVEAVEDLTDNMLPMLTAFRALARIPYWVLTRLGAERRAVNAMSAALLPKYPEVWRYKLYVLRKPRNRSQRT